MIGDFPNKAQLALRYFCCTPQDVAAYLDKDQLGLYELIWKRTVASQMESAVLDQVTVDIASADKTVKLWDADTGRELAVLKGHTDAVAAVAWSPDGKWIAFASDRTGSFEIYVIRPNGADLTRLTSNACEDTEPSWSPDGRAIAGPRQHSTASHKVRPPGLGGAPCRPASPGRRY